MKESEDTIEEYIDVEDLKKYIALSVEKKLIYLQEVNSFFMEAMTPQSKKAWEKLKRNGW